MVTKVNNPREQIHNGNSKYGKRVMKDVMVAMPGHFLFFISSLIKKLYFTVYNP